MNKKNKTIALVYGHRPQHSTSKKRAAAHHKHELQNNLAFVGLFVLGAVLYVLVAGATS